MIIPYKKYQSCSKPPTSNYLQKSILPFFHHTSLSEFGFHVLPTNPKFHGRSSCSPVSFTHCRIILVGQICAIFLGENHSFTGRLSFFCSPKRRRQESNRNVPIISFSNILEVRFNLSQNHQRNTWHLHSACKSRFVVVTSSFPQPHLFCTRVHLCVYINIYV